MNEIKVVGIDIAKQVFQIHAVDARGKAVLMKKITRDRLKDFVVNLRPCLIAMEACGSAHYWGREFQKMGHEVKLISPQYVKPYVKTNKNDMADAEAIAEAATRPSMRFVSVKSERQQEILATHKIRERLVKERTAMANEIRGLLYEQGIIFSVGMSSLKAGLLKVMSEDGNRISDSFKVAVGEIYKELIEKEGRISFCDGQIGSIYKESEISQRLSTIPGIGPITATAMTATVGNAACFRNGRQLSAWLGLVPRQCSSGGKNVLLGISKRGDGYVRKMLIHGARSVLGNLRLKVKDKEGNKWLRKIEILGFNKACVALANKNARRCWALMMNGTQYIDPNSAEA